MSARRLVSLVALAGVLRAAVPAAAETVDVTAMDGVQLVAELTGTTGAGVVLTAESSDRAAVTALARVLAAGGFRPLVLDPRGQGASSGSTDLTVIDRDVEGAYRYLLGRKIRPVFLVGSGAAGAAALAVAGRVPVAGIIVVSSPAASAVTVPVLRITGENGMARLTEEEVRARVLAFLERPTTSTVSP